jgi:lysophospholipase
MASKAGAETVGKLYPHSGNPLPRNASVQNVMTVDGFRLRAIVASPPNARATVVIMGGRADYLERYFETIRDLMRRGFAVVSFDWRGQGGSQRLHPDVDKGHGGSFKGFDHDLDAVMQQVAEVRCPRPFYAIAHSTGANVLIRALQNDPCWFTKAVVTSPLLGFRFGKWPPVLAKILTTSANLFGFGTAYLPGFSRGPFQRHEFNSNPLTSDADRWDRDITTLEANPQLGTGGPTFGWFAGALASIKALDSWNDRVKIGCPLLIVTPSNEWVVDANAARHFAARVPGVSFIQIRGSRHEILMERNNYRDQFWAAFDSFLDAPNA